MAAMPSPSSVADTSKVNVRQNFDIKKSNRNCIVRYCRGHIKSNERLQLFTFPKQLDMRAKWAENLQMSPEDIASHYRVCERHFEPRCIASHRLVENAVPTLELGYDYRPPHASAQLTGKGWRKCSIPNCKSNESEVYHRVPKDGIPRWNWLVACGLPLDTKDRYICGKHFHPDVGNKKRLPAGALPSLNLDIPPNVDDSYDRYSRSFDDESIEWWDPTSKDGCDNVAITYEFDPSISDEERRFYLKAYPTVDGVRERKVHCTVCKNHIGTAPSLDTSIKMHPILRVTHCLKCHDFYNSGEFSKGEDGSELYCRWCGQGGEVYCCSSCPYVFCKSCIVKNLSKGVVADIEQNENWNCFSCAPKILWPLRAQHWALMNYIEVQKKEIASMNLPEHEYKVRMTQDRSKCCRLAKSKCGNMSDSMESLDSVTSKRSQSSSGSAKKPLKHPNTPSPQHPNAKRAKPNDEVVCTPDLLSMLEPDCQITMAQKNNQRPMPQTSTPTARPMPALQQSYNSLPQKNSVPPPLVLRNTAIKLRAPAPVPIVRRTIVGPRAPMPGGSGTPVYHTINGYRIDLNSAAQQDTFRLPNGKLIQVKRQGQPAGSSPHPSSPTTNSWQIQSQPSPMQQQQRIVPQTIASRPVQITPHAYPGSILTPTTPQHPAGVRYHSNVIGNTTINAVGHNGAPLQVLNGQVTTQPAATIQSQGLPPQMTTGGPVRPVMLRHIFPDSPIGAARTQLQEQVFNAMEICTHLTNKVQTLTNSNAYKQARNYLEVKELYIHLSYLLTYAIGRYKGLQDKCLADMRKLGFGNDADSLENGQLAAAIDYVCYGQLEDVDLFNVGTNSFHNQVYEYRKSLHDTLKDGDDGSRSPLPPLFALGQSKSSEPQDDDEDSLLEAPQGNFKGHWLEGGEDSNLGFGGENEENEEPDDNDDDDYSRGGNGYGSFSQGTEESMRRNEESHSYDRKLTRLIAQYPSIWCTRHPDYGNFEVTRKHWRTIEAHFARGENIKLRWKNIRKRFVRIEKRIALGKRFNGHFDKAMAFLANRDLPEDQWVEVDCGEDDGDTFDRQNLDALEKTLHRPGDGDGKGLRDKDPYSFPQAMKPIEIEPLDLKIITFVKTNPVLWRKSMDLEADKIDEQTRQTVWRQLAKSLKTISADYIRDRWQHLYEMYKTFRLKTIKSSDDRSNLELKYSKYLAKLYFLYKIDEHELRNENNGLFEDCFELDDEDEEAAERGDTEDQTDADSGAEDPPMKLQDMPDDKDFLHKLVRYVREYPALWNTKHDDYHDIMVRDNYWQDIQRKLADYKHKQASDDEDNEIEIVEPKTDLINLDSDDDEPPPEPVKKSQPTNNVDNSGSQITPANTANTQPTPAAPTLPAPNVQQETSNNANMPDYDAIIPLAEENLDLMSMAQTFLASMLEVDIIEGSYGSQFSPNGSESTQPKKQPRKKLTNKPNPTLLKQKARMERERLAEMKRNDLKLKMQCAVKLKKAEEEFPYIKDKLNAKSLEKQQEREKSTTVLLDMGKEKLEVELVIVDESMNSSADDGIEEIIKNISEHVESSRKNSISMEKKENDTNAQIINTKDQDMEKDEKLKDKTEETEVVDTVQKLIASEENGKDQDTPTLDKKEDEEDILKDKIDLNIDKKNNESGTNDVTDSDKSEITDQPEESKSDNLKNEETVPDITMKDVVDEENAEEKNNITTTDKEVNENEEKSMEVDSAEEQSLRDDIKKIDEGEAQNKDDSDDSKKPLENVESKSCTPPEGEDDEVYKEIEKVLQHRRNSACGSEVNEKETVTDNEPEPEPDRVSEPEREPEREPEPERDSEPESETQTVNLSEEQTAKEPQHGCAVTTALPEVVDETNLKTADALILNDSKESNNECRKENEKEQNSIATATQDGLQEQCTSSAEVTSNGKV